MKKFKARREREHLEAMVRPAIEIEDPSEELFTHRRSWEDDDPLQDCFLVLSENLGLANGRHVPRLKIRSSNESRISCLEQSLNQFDLSSMCYSAEPQVVVGSCPTESYMSNPPTLPQRHPDHVHNISPRVRSQSLPPYRDLSTLSTSPSKADFQSFSQRCAPSPTSPSTLTTLPLFEMSAEEATYSMVNTLFPGSPAEMDGSPVETENLEPTPINYVNQNLEQEPEASPYNRFTAFTKSIHALNANLSPIEETEEEAASRRSSLALIYELPALANATTKLPTTYSGGSSIALPGNRYTISAKPAFITAPTRHISTQSVNPIDSPNSLHSVFSFEFSNSDTEKIYVSTPMDRRKSSAPSLTDVSSVDDLDVDLDLDIEKRPTISSLRRDAKLERFFGIRQYSVGSDLETVSPPNNEAEQSRPSLSIDDLDLSLAIENDPFKREMIAMHRSLLFKCQSKQDAKLEKFFGCDKDQIQVARKSSTGSRLAGCTDDLKYRSIGW